MALMPSVVAGVAAVDHHGHDPTIVLHGTPGDDMGQRPGHRLVGERDPMLRRTIVAAIAHLGKIRPATGVIRVLQLGAGAVQAGHLSEVARMHAVGPGEADRALEEKPGAILGDGLPVARNLDHPYEAAQARRIVGAVVAAQQAAPGAGERICLVVAHLPMGAEAAQAQRLTPAQAPLREAMVRRIGGQDRHLEGPPGLGQLAGKFDREAAAGDCVRPPVLPGQGTGQGAALRRLELRRLDLLVGADVGRDRAPIREHRQQQGEPDAPEVAVQHHAEPQSMGPRSMPRAAG